MRFATLLSVAITLPILAADPTPAQLAAPWLNRAAAELPKVRAEDATFKTPPTSVEMMLPEDVLATAIFECRPDAATRDRLLEIARRLEHAKPPDDQPLTRLNAAARPARLYAYAGAVDDARRFYPTIIKASAEWNAGEASPAPIFLTMVRRPAGDLPDDYVKQMSLFDLGMTIRALADDGKDDDAARLTAAVLTKVEPLTAANWIDRKLLAPYLVAARQLDAARKLTAGMDADKSDRADTLAAIAEACYAAGDRAAGAANFKDAVAAATPLTSDVERGAAVSAILRRAVDAGDPAACSAVATALAPLVDAQRYAPDVAARCHVATAFLIAGRRAEFDRHAAQATKQAASSETSRQSAHWITVAATYARAGDREQANASADKAVAARDPASTVPDEWQTLVEAHARAGNFDAAIAAARSRFPKPQDRDFPFYSIATLQAQAGQYAAAEQTAKEIDQPYIRLCALRRIVVERVMAGRTDGLLEWISANPAARQRAALHLAAAQQLLGREGKGATRTFAF